MYNILKSLFSSPGAPVDIQETYWDLYQSSISGDLKTLKKSIEVILESNWSLDRFERGSYLNALHVACFNNRVACVLELLKCGASTGIKTKAFDRVPMYFAAREENWSMIRILLLYGNVDIQTSNDISKNPCVMKPLRKIGLQFQKYKDLLEETKVSESQEEIFSKFLDAAKIILNESKEVKNEIVSNHLIEHACKSYAASVDIYGYFQRKKDPISKKMYTELKEYKILENYYRKTYPPFNKPSREYVQSTSRKAPRPSKIY